ncbi:MAG: hypothetical protein L0216_15615 [Planctomycetales bacterium]|nr:hypothetical protein [Planctomycetales bacterium]
MADTTLPADHRAAAARILGRIPASEPWILSELGRGLRDPALRAVCAESLRAAGEQAVKFLETYARDPDPEVAAAAKGALEALRASGRPVGR